jgi:hypothetical protein
MVNPLDLASVRTAKGRSWTNTGMAVLSAVARRAAAPDLGSIDALRYQKVP